MRELRKKEAHFYVGFEKSEDILKTLQTLCNWHPGDDDGNLSEKEKSYLRLIGIATSLLNDEPDLESFHRALSEMTAIIHTRNLRIPMRIVAEATTCDNGALFHAQLPMRALKDPKRLPSFIKDRTEKVRLGVERDKQTTFRLDYIMKRRLPHLDLSYISTTLGFSVIANRDEFQTWNQELDSFGHNYVADPEDSIVDPLYFAPKPPLTCVQRYATFEISEELATALSAVGAELRGYDPTPASPFIKGNCWAFQYTTLQKDTGRMVIRSLSQLGFLSSEDTSSLSRAFHIQHGSLEVEERYCLIVAPAPKRTSQSQIPTISCCDQKETWHSRKGFILNQYGLLSSEFPIGFLAIFLPFPKVDVEEHSF